MIQTHLFQTISRAAIVLSILLTPLPGVAQNRQPQNFWDDLWQRIIRSRDQERPRSSRGLICPVMPQLLESQVIWHDRPLFIWQGQADSVAVYKDKIESPAIWQRSVNQDTTSIKYDGPQLLPGVPYIWEVKGLGTSTSVQFQILNLPERQKIALHVSQLETQLRLKQASSDEQVQQRVDFFLKQELFLDAVQELFSVAQPSEEIKQLQQKLIKESCPK